jgi:hypothetical protein
MSANTFATFLDTIKALESGRGGQKQAWPESEVLMIAKTLLSEKGEAPLKQVMNMVKLPREVFLGRVCKGATRGSSKWTKRRMSRC